MALTCVACVKKAPMSRELVLRGAFLAAMAKPYERQAIIRAAAEVVNVVTGTLNCVFTRGRWHWVWLLRFAWVAGLN